MASVTHLHILILKPSRRTHLPALGKASSCGKCYALTHYSISEPSRRTHLPALENTLLSGKCYALTQFQNLNQHRRRTHLPALLNAFIRQVLRTYVLWSRRTHLPAPSERFHTASVTHLRIMKSANTSSRTERTLSYGKCYALTYYAASVTHLRITYLNEKNLQKTKLYLQEIFPLK